MSYIFFNDPHKDKLNIYNYMGKIDYLKNKIIEEINNALIEYKNEENEENEHKYYEAIKKIFEKIFEKYKSLKPCRLPNLSIQKKINCEEQKIKYYNNLITIIDELKDKIMSNKKNNDSSTNLQVVNSLEIPILNLHGYKLSKIDKVNLNSMLDKKRKIFYTKIKAHETKANTYSSLSSLSGAGGKKPTTKKPTTKKPTTKKPTAKKPTTKKPKKSVKK